VTTNVLGVKYQIYAVTVVAERSIHRVDITLCDVLAQGLEIRSVRFSGIDDLKMTG